MMFLAIPSMLGIPSICGLLDGGSAIVLRLDGDGWKPVLRGWLPALEGCTTWMGCELMRDAKLAGRRYGDELKPRLRAQTERKRMRFCRLCACGRAIQKREK
jgi:hypothetical protein